ncbi:Swi5-domain-containing protein [Neurospora crassa]|nr:Swi5-domain-containing protein [Neurospora crassa]
MSGRPTPRKGRSRNNHSYNNGGSRESGPRYAQQSDYDSDAVNTSYAAQPRDAENRMYDPKNYVPEVDESATYVHTTTRTNYELNMSVLKRYVSGLRAILLTCSFVRLYEWSSTTNSWELRDVEGPMFLCECDPIVLPTGHELPQVNLFVLNRRSMENLTINLSKVEMYEATNEKFLSLKTEADEAGPGRALGFHLHSNEEKGTGDSQGQFLMEYPDWSLIQAQWEKARAALSAVNNQVVGAPQYEQGVPNNGAAVADYAQAPAPWASLGAFVKGMGEVDNIIMTPTSFSRAPKPMSQSSVTDLPEDLAQAAQTQIDLIASCRRWLDNHTPIGCTASMWREVNAKLVAFVAEYKIRIEDLKLKYFNGEPSQAENKNQDGAILDSVWKLRVHQSKSVEPVLIITIGGDNQTVEVKFETRDQLESVMRDEYFGYLTKVFQAFDQAEKDLIQLFDMSRKMEQERAALSQPPEETVQTHIELLKEYNDMKDIGQQLIGLIADNKGVPIGALYEDGQYGVTADD